MPPLPLLACCWVLALPLAPQAPPPAPTAPSCCPGASGNPLRCMGSWQPMGQCTQGRQLCCNAGGHTATATMWGRQGPAQQTVCQCAGRCCPTLAPYPACHVAHAAAGHPWAITWHIGTMQLLWPKAPIVAPSIMLSNSKKTTTNFDCM